MTLNYPGILHVRPVEHKSRPSMVMEHLEGQTLRIVEGAGQADLDQAVAIAIKACDALDDMHPPKIIHRDLKPENVMLCSDGSIRIMDFGIAKVAGLRRLTFSGLSSAMGTRIPWPRSSSKENGETNGPTLTVWAPCFTK